MKNLSDARFNMFLIVLCLVAVGIKLMWDENYLISAGVGVTIILSLGVYYNIVDAQKDIIKTLAAFEAYQKTFRTTK